ncbi:ribosomal RNA small subunit methyltransferase A [Adlercreutzia aquisgranensis]|uniref:ribosomal RNA small subunit methyltransferase A n=1 Tax=Adlercreutzia aquisgranensis TaxID=2941323 RepID=UPI002041DFC1|nr:rRNA adenine dimethyltransferase family protein [Adlercreutzia aquisgranensis]
MGKASPYASLSATRAVLDAHGLQAKYSLGQNFLVNDDIVRKSLELAEVGPGDAVLEVGPGIGTLTCALLGAGAQVAAVERDADLPPVLAETTAPWAERFALVRKDALDLSAGDLAQAFDSLGVASGLGEGGAAPSRFGAAGTELTAPAAELLPGFKLVANLPYAVAATLVLDYFQRFPTMTSATVMVQREVADRMMAHPGTKAYGAYTVKLGFFARPAGRFPVGPANFFPQPRVESAVIRLDRVAALGDACASDPRAGARTDDVPDSLAASAADLSAACLMADAAFASRRKTLANSCKQFFSGRGAAGARMAERLPELFAAAGIDSKRRGETLDRAEFMRLACAWRSMSDAARGCKDEPSIESEEGPAV